jgi:serum/glucocorticoid-regulated kinase 2
MMAERMVMLRWSVGSLTLKEFATTKQDRKRGISRIPAKQDAENVSQLEFHRQMIERLNFPLTEFQQIDDVKTVSENRHSQTIFSPMGDEVNIDSFKVLKLLGRGTFGKVSLVAKKDTGKLYAMK